MHPLRQWRKKKKWTCRDLGTMVGVTGERIGQIERGRNAGSRLAFNLSFITKIPMHYFIMNKKPLSGTVKAKGAR